MKLKTVEIDGKTYAEVQDGKPVFTGDDGREVAFDAPHTVQTINRLNGEAKGHRERAEKAEGSLKAFEAITDPAAAIKALETVSRLDEKSLVDAGERDKAIAAAVKAAEARYAPIIEERDALRGQLHEEKIGGSFSRSKFVSERLAIPADLAEARFGKHFSLKDGKVVATDATGNQIFSRTRPGEPADFDEAFEVLIEAYPHKDNILRGDIKPGGGASNAGTNGGTKTMKQSAFDALDPKSRAARMAEGYSITEG